MESFLSKLKSTVSEVLPGNPLSSDYEIQDRVIGSAGPDLVWKIYRASKKTTKEAACVFVFDKKSIDKLTKDDKKIVIASLKRGIQQLTKLRHPKILSVVHPIEENRDCLAFATEPVLMSLANVLSSESEDAGDKLDEVEIKYGLIQVLEGVAFLHNDVRLVHGNLHPSSILLNDKKVWKLSGFDFYSSAASQSSDSTQFECTEWRPGLPRSTQPELDYLAPERVTRGYCDTKSDMYSLGVTIHAIYNQDKPVYQSHSSLASFKQLSSEMRNFRVSLLRNIPSTFHESFKSLLSLENGSRPDAKSLLKIAHFEDMTVMTVVYLDSLVQRDNLQKSQFFKSLPNVLKQLPLSICLYRVLPTLFAECSNRDMIPFVLQNILVIAERCSKQEYSLHIYPKLTPIFSIFQPIQIPLLLLKNMPLLLSQTADRDTKTHILPMLFTSIEINNTQLQELCLDILPEFSHLIDKHSMKTSVIPRVRALCIATQYLNLRVKCLVSIGKMVTHMDKWFVLDEVLPFLQQIPSKEPAILMAILGIHKIVFTNKELGIPKDQLATKCLPLLIQLSVDHALSRPQFTSYMSVIKDMISTVETEHLSKLKELEQQSKEESSLTFNGHHATSDSVMEGFLSEAGLITKPAATLSSTPVHAVTKKPVSVQQIPKPQVKDLTATLGATAIKPIPAASPYSTVRPIASPLAGVRPQARPIQSSSLSNTSQAQIPRPPVSQSAKVLQPMSSLNSGQQSLSMTASNSHMNQQSFGAGGNNSPIRQQSFGAGGNNSPIRQQSFGAGGNNSPIRQQSFGAGGNNSHMNQQSFGAGGNNSPIRQQSFGVGGNASSMQQSFGAMNIGNMSSLNSMSSTAPNNAGWSMGPQSNTQTSSWSFNSPSPQQFGGGLMSGAGNPLTGNSMGGPGYNYNSHSAISSLTQSSVVNSTQGSSLSQNDINDLLG